jgi:DNA mismatch repair protein MutS
MSEVKKIATRDSYGAALVELAKDHPDVVVLDADLAAATKTGVFKKAYPDRHFDCGIAESNMMATAAGMAAMGLVPFASSFAMFAAGRAFEQVRNSIGYPHLNVKIGATHGGISVGEDGASHQCCEDIALMRSIPGMVVLSPADDVEARKMVKAAYEMEGPVYMRFGRAATPVFHDEDYEFQIGKGEVIAQGVDTELDELRGIVTHGKDIIAGIQQREIERTGITSLRISYNNVFGYYLEVRNAHKDKVPPEWIRKQTLVSAERYITPELKEYEEKIGGAEEKIYAIESRIFNELITSIQAAIPAVQKDAALIARLDCLLSFAQAAADYGYCRPLVDEGEILKIEQGRHPVIERMMPAGEEYVANDLYLDSEKQQIIILTGPNMSGKSALLRQTALIAVMAQIGSFVPAKSAHISLFDKIFTRVGASDNISRGESTFMVEMLETAAILNNMTPRSLILLDEIGRGTSTFDGMSIAWAIVEYIHERGGGAKTLFATHYHELNELEENYKRVKNFHIAVKESDGKILFLRKLCEGGVAHSFGIHVARLAGVPPEVVLSAEKVLKKLEAGASGAGDSSIKGRVQSLRQKKRDRSAAQEEVQLSIFQLDDPLLVSIRDTLKAMDLNSMTPMDAFDTLRELQRKVGINK